MFERSVLDSDGDGVGVQVYDVGVAADGLRGEQLYRAEDGSWDPIRFNSHSEWMAAKDAPELWAADEDGNPRLPSTAACTTATCRWTPSRPGSRPTRRRLGRGCA